MKRKILLSCYAICMLLMSVILMWRASSGYVFAYEYNSMNGKENADGETYMNLSVDTDNPFIVSTDSDIIAAIDEGYTGYIYFGYPTCPYCRNTVPVLMDEFKENEIRRVLYCNLKKYNYQYKYDTDVGVIETQHGSKSYDMLLDILHEYASPKVVKDIDGNVIQTGKNTLYVPAIVRFENGVPSACWQYKDAGIVLNDNQSVYDEWSDEQKNIIKHSIESILF